MKIMENPIKMDDLGVFPYFWKHPYSAVETNSCEQSEFASLSSIAIPGAKVAVDGWVSGESAGYDGL